MMLGSDSIYKNITLATKFDYNSGSLYPVVLPDGSLVYSNEFIENILKNIDKVDGVNDYRIRKDLYYQEYAVAIFSKLVEYIQEHKIEVVFIMIPCHHSVTSRKDQIITKTLSHVNKKIYELAKILRVSVMGSYDPNDLRCFKDEFYDEYHPKDSCLVKLGNKVILNEY